MYQMQQESIQATYKKHMKYCKGNWFFGVSECGNSFISVATIPSSIPSSSSEVSLCSQSSVNKKHLAYKRWSESKSAIDDDRISTSSNKSIRIPSPVMKKMNSAIPVLPQDIIKI